MDVRGGQVSSRHCAARSRAAACAEGTRCDGRPEWRSRTAAALRMSRREMLRERQVTAPLMARRAARGALGLAHRRFQPGEGVGVHLAGLRLGGKPQRASQRQLGHETLVRGFALIAPAASRPGQHCAVRRQRGRQVAPCGHASTVGQRFLRLVLRDGLAGHDHLGVARPVPEDARGGTAREQRPHGSYGTASVSPAHDHRATTCSRSHRAGHPAHPGKHEK
jgi:hypothetical protein